MNTEFLVVTENDKEIIKKAGVIIRSGGLVAFPTETVYGLGGNALDSLSANKIFKAKGRPSDNPLIVHICEAKEAENFAYTNDLYYKLAETFMPGPLTIILPKKECIPDSVTGGLNSVAIRCPEHPIARALIKEASVPIAAPSANLSGSPSPTTAKHVFDDLNGRIDMILDGGESRIGVESTVVKIEDESCTVLRPGDIIPRELAKVIPNVYVSEAVLKPQLAGDKPLSPGMKYKHYAPKAEFFLIDANEENFIKYVNSIKEKALVLAYSELKDKITKDYLDIGSKYSPKELMHNLFSVLRKCDSFEYTKIYAQLPIQNEDYLALNNRIIRAANNQIIRI